MDRCLFRGLRLKAVKKKGVFEPEIDIDLGAK